MSTQSATKVSFPVYLLAMEGNNPRRDIAIGRVTEQFGKEPILVDGVNGLRGTTLNGRFWPGAEGSAKLSRGQLACATGHLTILTRFLQSGEEFCLIVEDDVEFIQEAFLFESVLYDVRHADPLWSWIHCGGIGGVVEGPRWAAMGTELKGARLVIECSWNTCCYFISRRGACSILSRATPLSCVYDAYTRYAGPGDHLYNATQNLYRQDPAMKSIIGMSPVAVVSAPNLADPCLRGTESQHEALHATTP
jgi:hypothetical protein